MKDALTLQGVTKAYEDSGFVLDNISFSLPSGSILGFVGENGAGKTTTIGCILNTLSPDSGSVKLFGKELTAHNTKLLEAVGLVYDDDNFPAYLNARQLSRILEGFYSQWDSALFQDFLKKFQLKETQKIGKYSKGMKRKLALASALSHRPKLLILDEATCGLDPVTRDEMLDVFLDFVGEEDHSILLSSHITSDLEKIADHIVFLHQGKLVLTEMKDRLLYQYGILRCREKDFASVAPEDILACRKRDYQIDVLVADREKAKKKYPGIVIDHTTIDEIMLLLMKGERR